MFKSVPLQVYAGCWNDAAVEAPKRGAAGRTSTWPASCSRKVTGGRCAAKKSLACHGDASIFDELKAERNPGAGEEAPRKKTAPKESEPRLWRYQHHRGRCCSVNSAVSAVSACQCRGACSHVVRRHSSTPILFARIQRRNSSTLRLLVRSTIKSGFRCVWQRSIVIQVPPTGSPEKKTSAPSRNGIQEVRTAQRRRQHGFQIGVRVGECARPQSVSGVAAMRNAASDGDVECSAIDAGLSA